MKKRTTVKLLSTLFVLAVLFLMWREFAPEPYRIGFIADLSAINGDTGQSMLNGARLAVKQINDAGGINGTRLRMTSKDNKHNPDALADGLKAIEKKGARFIIGPFTEDTSNHALSLTAEEETVFVIPYSGGISLAGGEDRIFRLAGYDANLLDAFAMYLKEQNIRRLVVVTDSHNPVFGSELTDGLIQRYRDRGGVVISRIDYAKESIAADIDSLRGKKTDGFLLLNGQKEAGDTLRAIRAYSPAPVFISGLTAGETFLKAIPAEENALYVASAGPVVMDTASPWFSRFAEAYTRAYQTAPDAFAMLGYDAVFAIAKTIQHMEDSGKDADESILKIPPFIGISGNISFDTYGDVPRPLSIGYFRNGSFHLLD